MTGQRKVDKAPIVVVEHDINTLAEEIATVQYSLSDMHDFFEKAALEADEILRIYFPD
jgi:hypothetical protein